MNVLFATYPMAFHTPGGGEIQLLAYKKHLPAHGVEVSLFDPWNPHFYDYDVVHFFSCVGGSIHFCNFVKNLGIPLVISSSLWVTEKTKHLYPTDEIRAQLKLADSVITNSKMESATIANTLDLPKDKFFTVYNGVDNTFFENTKSNLFSKKFNVTSPFILNVGNIEPRKNQLFLALAMRNFPNHKLVLIGHIRDESYFQKIRDAAGDQLLYVEALEYGSDLLKSAYTTCEVFALPSTLETPGLAALEAAALGAPLLLTNEGSCQEYFGDSAIYVSPTSIESISSGLMTVNKYLLKPDIFNFKEKYAWENIMPSLAKIYSDLINR